MAGGAVLGRAIHCLAFHVVSVWCGRKDIHAQQDLVLLQLSSQPSKLQRTELPHDEEFNECDATKPEPPFIDVMGPDRFHFAEKSKVIVDIGGNTGYDVDMMLQKNPGAKIYTFEPIPEYFKGLETKYASRPNVRVQKFAVSNADGRTEFILDGVGTTGADKTVQGEHVPVQLRDVDELLNQIQVETGQVPDMVNMNCEGCEYAVMNRLLEKGWLEKLPFIQLSWHLAGDVEDRVGKRCNVEKRLWQTHARTFRAGYGWIGWQKSQ